MGAQNFNVASIFYWNGGLELKILHFWRKIFPREKDYPTIFRQPKMYRAPVLFPYALSPYDHDATGQTASTDPCGWTPSRHDRARRQCCVPGPAESRPETEVPQLVDSATTQSGQHGVHWPTTQLVDVTTDDHLRRRCSASMPSSRPRCCRSKFIPQLYAW